MVKYIPITLPLEYQFPTFLVNNNSPDSLVERLDMPEDIEIVDPESPLVIPNVLEGPP